MKRTSTSISSLFGRIAFLRRFLFRDSFAARSLLCKLSIECVNLRIKRHVNRSADDIEDSLELAARMFVRDLYSLLHRSLHRLARWKEPVEEGTERLSVHRLRFSFLWSRARLMRNMCQLLPFSVSLAGPSTASGESLAKYLTCERAQLRRDSETPNKRSGIGKDTVHYEIPPGNQRTETPPFTNAMNRAPFNAPPTIIPSLLIYLFSTLFYYIPLSKKILTIYK